MINEVNLENLSLIASLEPGMASEKFVTSAPLAIARSYYLSQRDVQRRFEHFLYLHAGSVLGLCCAERHQHSVTIFDFYITAERQRLGHGKDFVLELEQYIYSKFPNVKDTIVVVHRQNHRANRFWRRAGYGEMSEIKFAEHDDALMLVKPRRLTASPV